MKRLFKYLAVLACLGLTGMGIAGYFAYQTHTTPGPLEKEAIVQIPEGATLNTIATILDEHNIIAHPRLFRLAARLRRIHDSLRAGEYKFTPPVSQADVLDKLHAGTTYRRSITIPEGWTSAQAVQRLRATHHLSGTIGEIPEEGSLLPETYHYRAGTQRITLIRRMRTRMNKLMTRLWPHRDKDLPLDSREEAVILASLVEKETGRKGERDKVSGVFINRLEAGMRLQSDPSVIYAITGGKPEMKGRGPIGRRLLKRDLEIDSPYNTYKNRGLPPGPIANPGRKAIKAALNWAEHNYLYFVADGSGGHNFAETLEAHNSNVRQWRKIRDEEDK